VSLQLAKQLEINKSQDVSLFQNFNAFLFPTSFLEKLKIFQITTCFFPNINLIVFIVCFNTEAVFLNQGFSSRLEAISFFMAMAVAMSSCRLFSLIA
jgi:hypothetical protein